jgi:hypothetical protein
VEAKPADLKQKVIGGIYSRVHKQRIGVNADWGLLRSGEIDEDELLQGHTFAI